jgi:hypothetical protein
MAIASRRLLTTSLLLSAAALLAQAQDLLLDQGDGILVASAVGNFRNNGTTLTTDPSSQPTIAAYNAGGQIANSSCPVSIGYSINLLNAAKVPYASARVNAGYSLTVSYAITGGSFLLSSDGPGYPPYTSYQLEQNVNDYATGTTMYFNVIDSGGTPQCANLASYSGLNGVYLRISTSNSSTVPGKSDGGDPQLPINGGSMVLIAPQGLKFACSGNPGKTAKLNGVNPAKSFGRVFKPSPAETNLLLTGITDWVITAYPQQLKISPSFWGHAYDFEMPTADLSCGSDNTSLIVTLNGQPVKPQQFVIDWSRGWFAPRQYLTIPCRNSWSSASKASCNLVLTPKK